MTFTATLRRFLKSESGAVTVDWVVLTAAIVGLGIAVISSVSTGVGDLGTDIQTSLSGATVVSLGELGSSGAAASGSDAGTDTNTGG